MQTVVKLENDLGFGVHDDVVDDIVSPVFDTESQAAAFLESGCLDGAHSAEASNHG
jgi:hypothetical protein